MLSTLHFFHVLAISVVFVSGCFITNCPPGGKRSESEEKTHQCEQCGPPGMGGRCFGPQICCSPEFGCLVGTSVTTACTAEANSPSLCRNPGASCDGSTETGPINGQCAAVGICCTPETCTRDDDCPLARFMEADKGHPVKSESGLLVQRLPEYPRHILPLLHEPWSYRRIIHSQEKLKNSMDGKEPDSIAILSTSQVQGPPFFPPGPTRLADYF